MSCISIARLPDGLFSTMLQVGVLGERPDLPPIGVITMKKPSAMVDT